MRPRSLPFALSTIAAFAAAAVFARNADEVTPLLIGKSVPKVTIANEQGVSQFLPALLKDKYSVVVFYRGGWCPYCNAHLQELASIESELVERGYQIIAISPDSPQTLSSIEKDGELNYALYSDSSLEAAEAFGIDFQLSKETLDKYEGYGISLEKSSGGLNKNRLPVPSVFIVTPDNKIAFSYVNPDITNRIPADLLIASAKAIKE